MDFNSEGFCEDIVPGCFSINSDDFTQCEECHPGFILTQNNQCACPSGLTINTDHYCSKCNVPGCKKCYPEHENVCAECYEAFNLEGDFCVCEEEKNFPNEQKECSECLVEGCIKCHSRDPFNCLQHTIISEEYAECSQKDCKECRSYKNEEVCLNCVQTLFVDNGVCQECQIRNCETCHSPTTCSKCNSLTTLRDGVCFCHASYYFYKLTETNTCTNCFVGGCSKCSSNNRVCRECQDFRATLVNDRCVCPEGEYLQPAYGFCKPCRVAGCLTCAPNSPEVCVKCYGSNLVNGKCVCTSANQLPS